MKTRNWDFTRGVRILVAWPWRELWDPALFLFPPLSSIRWGPAHASPRTLFGTSKPKKLPVFLSCVPGVCHSDETLTNIMNFPFSVAIFKDFECESIPTFDAWRNVVIEVPCAWFWRSYFVSLYFFLLHSVFQFAFFFKKKKVSCLILWEREMNLYIFPSL